MFTTLHGSENSEDHKIINIIWRSLIKCTGMKGMQLAVVCMDFRPVIFNHVDNPSGLVLHAQLITGKFTTIMYFKDLETMMVLSTY